MAVVTARLMGGLCNQMFQVATAYALALDTNRTAVFSETCDSGCSRRKDYKDSVLRNITRLSQEEMALKRWTHWQEPGHPYFQIPNFSWGRENDWSLTTSTYLNGYFQSFRYFDHHKEEIRKLFDATEETWNRIKSKYGAPCTKCQCRGDFSDSVSIHVRRGDYVHLSHVHHNLSTQYYCEALDKLKTLVGEEEFPKLKYYIFSDDLDWCRNQPLFQSLSATYVDEEDYICLHCMMLCEHHILANSSFSFWGAYLTTRPQGHTILPATWFGPAGPVWNIGDIALKEWHVIQ